MIRLILLSLTVIIVSCNSSNQKHDSADSKALPSSEEVMIKDTTAITGAITTKVDGVDVQQVNLWSKISSDRTVTATMKNGERVKILKDVDPYYLVESSNQDGRQGYCMKGFVVVDKD